MGLWMANKIMLSGLCQTLLSCGVLLEWPTLYELQQEEQRCAMYLCMSMDFFESMAPYACMVSLHFMQIAWGVFWRQKGLATSVDGNGMAKWLLRRGNEFMSQFVASEDMTSPGLVFGTERLMGGPVSPEEWFQRSADEFSQDTRKAHATTPNARPIA